MSREERDRFISENIGLVHSCANRFRGRGMEYDDLFQAGCLGLVKAADAFDSTRGVRFSTYAVPVILGEIRRLFRDGGTVKVGRTLKELSLKATREAEAFRRETQREPTVDELAARLGVEPAEAAQALGAAIPPLSLTQSDDEGGGQIDISVDSHEEKIAELLSLRQVVCELEPRDQRIVVMRFFQSKTQTQTAAALGMTQVQVSRREKAILSAMRSKLTG
ncbi:MAG: sigma-70 family RNA polymerase sigma factor [Firmicutes bacterium]|nr:sigma-70 family RNA polymerase sigma factor [Bacillota bacterium]